MTIATLIVASMLAAPNPSKALLSLFEEGEYYPKSGRLQGERIRYRLFVPHNIGRWEQCPLFVWLHGYGESGDDNRRNIKWLGHVFRDMAHIEKYRFFLLAVQCPSKHRLWYRSESSLSNDESDDMLAIKHQIIQKIIADRPVDKNRVFVTGVSHGGTACWVMASRYPDLFSAIVPTASYPPDLLSAERLVNFPIWAFHNLYDPMCPPDRERWMVEMVNEAGGNAHIFLSPRKKHSCFIPAYQECDILNWMQAQKRGAWVCWTPPGCRVWSWWHILAVPFGFVAVGWLGLHLRRRRLDNRAG